MYGKEHPQWKENPGTSSLHQRVVRKRGKASEHLCVDCGGQAYDWSLTHGENPQEFVSYEPRCRSCHLKYDYTDERRAKVALGNHTRIR